MKRLPPGLSTRFSSRSPCSTPGVCWRMPLQSTKSNSPSSNGISSTDPWRKVTLSTPRAAARRAASSSPDSLTSIPTTDCAPMRDMAIV